MLEHNKRTSVEMLARINVKLALVLWGVAYILYPPQKVVDELGMGLIVASGVVAILGSVFGIIGLVMSNSDDGLRTFKGLVIEYSGLLVAVCGPLGFFVTAAYLTIDLGHLQGVSFTALAYALTASLIGRILAVRRGFKRMPNGRI